MRKYRLERTDLKRISLRNRTPKDKTRHKIYENFDNPDKFLNFITNGLNDDEIFPWLLRIAETLDYQLSMRKDTRVYNELNYRILNDGFMVNDDYRIRAASIRIIGLLCTDLNRLIKIVLNCQDIILLRVLYTTKFHIIERTEALHFFTEIFQIFMQSRSASLLLGWWRFRFFIKNVLLSLIEIGLDSNRRSFSEHKQSIDTPDASQKDNLGANHRVEKLRILAYTALLEISLKYPYLFLDLNIGFHWFVLAVQNSFIEQNSPTHGILMQIFSSWLDSPNLRHNAKLNLIIQKIFSPISEMAFFQGSKNELNASGPFSIIDACKQSLICLLNNWSGLFSLFATGEKEGDHKSLQLNSSSCFRLLNYIGKNTVLTPNIEKIQVIMVDLICELLNLSYVNIALNSGSWDEAFVLYKKMRFPDSYNSSLREDFVLAEIAFMHSIQNSNNIDLLKTYRVLIVFSLVNAGLPEALIRLILQNPDDAISLKATLLLADILRLSFNLPQNYRLQVLSTHKLVHHNVKAFQSRTLKELARQKIQEVIQEGIPSLNDVVFSNGIDQKVSWSNAASDNYRHSILLIDRLDRVNDLMNKPILLADLHLVNTFLITDKEFRRKRGDSILSRHSSASGDPNKIVDEHNMMAEDNSSEMDSDLNELIGKAFTVITPISIGNDSQSSPNLFNITGIGVGVPIIPIQAQQQQSGGRMNKPVWSVLWKLLSIVDDQLAAQTMHASKSNHVSKIIDKCVPILNQLIFFFLPSNQELLTLETDPLSIPCGQFAFHLLCLCAISPVSIGADNAKWAFDLLTSFLYDFGSHLNQENSESVFNSKNLLCTGSSNYFSILRILFSHAVGHRIFEQTGLGQILFDRISDDSTAIELIKLIVSSLNYYSINDSDIVENKNASLFSRNLLENILTSTKDIAIRKWCTRFLDSFFTLTHHGYIRNFDWNWTIQLVFRQLSDPSPKIMMKAIELLHKWLPYCPNGLKKETNEMLKRARIENLDEPGNLLEAFLYDNLDNEPYSSDLRKMAEKSLCKWKESFCIRYVDIVEEKMRRALIRNSSSPGLFCYKRSMDGSFARASNQQTRKKKTAVYCPIHLFGQLARTSFGRQLLFEYKIMENLEETLLQFLSNKHQSDQVYSTKPVKAALFSMGHILANIPSNQLYRQWPIPYYAGILHACVEQELDNTNCSSAYLSIRGCALWAVNIAAKGNPLIASILSNEWEFGENELFSSFDSDYSVKFKKESIVLDDAQLLPDHLLSEGRHLQSISSASISRKCSATADAQQNAAYKLDWIHIHSKQELRQRQKERRLFSESDEYVPNQQPDFEKLPNRASSFKFIDNSTKAKFMYKVLDKLQFEKHQSREHEMEFKNYNNLLMANDTESAFLQGFYNRSKSKNNNNINHQLTKYRNVAISDQENSALIIYRRFLSKMTEQNGENASARTMPLELLQSSKNQPNDGYGVFLPKHIETLYGNVFVDEDIPSLNLNGSYNMVNIKTHNEWFCLYCSSSKGAKITNKIENNEHRMIILEYIYQMTSQLSNAEVVAKLLRYNKDNAEIFSNPCIFSDALHIIADSKTIGFEGRQLIYQLFWDAI